MTQQILHSFTSCAIPSKTRCCSMCKYMQHLVTTNTLVLPKLGIKYKYTSLVSAEKKQNREIVHHHTSEIIPERR